LNGLGPRSVPSRTAGIGRIDVHRIRLPLARPWVSPVAALVDRELLLVAVTVEGVVGWGECAAPVEPTYSPEYVDGALGVLARHLIPRALQGPVGDPADLDRILAPVKGHPMAKAALSAAYLDAHLRIRGVNLADHLAGLSRRVDLARWFRPAAVPAGAAVGVSDSIDALVSEVGDRVAEGYRRIKIKVHPGWDLEAVVAVRGAFGAGLALQVDANATYGSLGVVEAARRLARLDGHGLIMIEQPLGDEDLVGHARLAELLGTPVCLDESISSYDVAVSALALRACGVLNLKPGRVGGLAPAVAIHDLCADAGVAVWCGGMLETGVGRAANLALATLPNFTLPGDLSASDRYWVNDVVTHPARLRGDGSVAVPTGAGNGVEVIDDLSRWTLSIESWPR